MDAIQPERDYPAEFCSGYLPTFADSAALLSEWCTKMLQSGTEILGAWVCFRGYTEAEIIGSAGCADCFLNWLSRRYSEQYKHVELVFQMMNNGTREVHAWTVDLPNPARAGTGFVRLVEREPTTCYRPEIWRCFRLADLTQLEHFGLMAYCLRQLGKPINSRGLYWNFLPLLRVFTGYSLAEEDSYFCSQLVASALKWIRPQRYYFVEPRQCTPVVLLQMLAANGELYESVAFKHVRYNIGPT